MRLLPDQSLIELTAGGDKPSCPLEEGRRPMYYLGYIVSFIVPDIF